MVKANLVVGFVAVAAVPIIFLGVAVYSTIYAHSHRQTREQLDIEMQPYHRIWFPWKYRKKQPHHHQQTETSLSGAGPPVEPITSQPLYSGYVPAWARDGAKSPDTGQNSRSKASAWVKENVRPVESYDAESVLVSTATSAYEEEDPPGPSLIIEEEPVNPYRPYSLPPIRPGFPTGSGRGEGPPRRMSDVAGSDFFDDRRGSNAAGGRKSMDEREPKRSLTGKRR